MDPFERGTSLREEPRDSESRQQRPELARITTSRSSADLVRGPAKEVGEEEGSAKSGYDPDRLLVDARGLAALLGIAPRTVRALNSSGRIPRPLSLGRRRLWCVREIEQWLEARAPERSRWEELRKGRA